MGRITRFLSGAGRPREDHTGKRFGALVALREVEGDDGHWYWECQCECGRVRLVQTRTMVRNPPDRCICDLRRGKKPPTNPTGVTARNHLYATYRAGAQRRGLPFDLTLEQFLDLTQRRCFYCGVAPMTEHRARLYQGSYTHNGIDRRDNTQGYTVRNCLPCCENCNYIKGDIPYDEFMAWLDRVVRYRG